MENHTTAAQKIFFSYSRQDGQEHALKLASDLRTAGANVWIDQLDIELGKLWDLEVEKALNTADCVLFIATEKSTASNNVLNEVYYALDENKKVIPVVFHDCRIPFQLRRLQRIDFTTGYDAAFQRLLKALGFKTEEISSSKNENSQTPNVASTLPVAKEENKNQLTPAQLKEEPVVTAKPIVLNSREVHQAETNPAKSFASEEKAASLIPEKKHGKSRKMFFWGLGVLVVAAIVILVTKVFSGGEGNPKNEVAFNAASADSLNKAKKNADSGTAGLKQTISTGMDTGTLGTSKSSTKNTQKKSMTPEEDFNSQFQNGLKAYAAGNYEAAIGAFNRALVAKDDAETFFHRGLCYGALKDFPSAIADYSKAIGLNSKMEKYYFSRAAAYHNNKDFKASVSDWNKVIELMPDNADAYFRRGINKRALSDASACDDFATAAKLGSAEGKRTYELSCVSTMPQPVKSIQSISNQAKKQAKY